MILTLTTSKRTVSLTVVAYPDRVEATLTSPVPGIQGDEGEVFLWLQRTLAPYEDDPRPLHLSASICGSA